MLVALGISDTYNDQKVGMRPCEDWDVHGHTDRVGFVQPDAKVAFSTEKQEDEDPDVHQTHSGYKRKDI